MTYMCCESRHIESWRDALRILEVTKGRLEGHIDDIVEDYIEDESEWEVIYQICELSDKIVTNLMMDENDEYNVLIFEREDVLDAVGC